MASRVLGALAALLLVPQAASAGGITSARFGGESGTPTGDLPTAIYYNPAALALGSGTRLYVEGLVALRNASYDRPVDAIDNRLADGESGTGTPDDALAANSGEATLSNVLVSPFLGVASDLGVKGLGVGLAFFVPFGGQSKWDENAAFAGSSQYPGAVDGVQRWSTIEGELRALYVSAGGAYTLPGARLSIGGAVSFVKQQIHTVRARTAAGTDDLVFGATLAEGRSEIDVSGSSIAAALGVLWQPTDTVWLGLSYQSQPGFGETRQQGTFKNKFGSDAVAVTETEVLQSMPDVVRLGGRMRVTPEVELRLSLDFQRWSVFDNQCLLNVVDGVEENCDLEADGSQGPAAEGIAVVIPRHWKNTYGVRGGGSYWLSPALELAGGLSFDTAAVPAKYIDPSLMDMTKVIVHAGVRYALMDNLALNLFLNDVIYFTREVAPRARNADGTSDGYLAPSRVPDFAGTYKLNVLYANLGVDYRF